MDKIKNFINLMIDNSVYTNIYSSEIAIKDKFGLRLTLEPIKDNDDFMLLEIEENNKSINKKYVLNINDFSDEILRIYDIENYNIMKNEDLNKNALKIFKDIHASLITILEGNGYNKELYSDIEIDKNSRTPNTINIYLTERERNVTSVITIDKVSIDSKVQSLLSYSVCNITFLEDVIGEKHKYKTTTIKINLPNIKNYSLLDEKKDLSIESTFSKIKNKSIIEFLELSHELKKKSENKTDKIKKTNLKL